MEVHDVSGRILIDVSDMLSLAAGDPQLDSDLRRELADLADELNSNLDGYEVMLAHLDTADYLSFEKRDPTEGAFWAAEQAEREAIVAGLFAEGTPGGRIAIMGTPEERAAIVVSILDPTRAELAESILRDSDAGQDPTHGWSWYLALAR